MLFNSLEFIFIFLPITLLFFFLIGIKGYYKLAISWLVAASLFFYGWWNPVYLGLIIFSIFFNYLVGSFLSPNSKVLVSRRLLFILGIAVNLTIIGYFKYANLFASTVNTLIGSTFRLDTIILPLGISFFTFEQIAYLVDTYRGETKKYNFLNYCLFVVFFPRLIAGPIVRYEEVMPQFINKSIYRFNDGDMAVGLTIFSLGLFKKVIFADSIAQYVSPVFDAAAQGVSLTFFEAWVGALAYSLQLYFDFSGYSDMAMGIARMFGIKLPLNFNSPYKAVDIIDFWRRWHITLSRFLRDYLYIPLGGNRKGEFRRYLNLMITMLLGGLWHGAGWTFVFWGGLHGTYLIINHQWRSFRRSLGHDLNKSYWLSQGLGWLTTFIAVVIAWVFFRAENINDAISILKGMIGINGISIPESFSTRLAFMQNFGIRFEGLLPCLGKNSFEVIFWVLFLIIIAWFTPNNQQWMEQHISGFYKPTLTEDFSSSTIYFWKKLQWQPNKLWSTLLGILLFLGIKTILSAPASEFLYFNF